MTTISLPTCLDCDRVMPAAGRRCYTCQLSLTLVRRSEQAAADERALQGEIDRLRAGRVEVMPREGADALALVDAKIEVDL